MRYTVPFGRGTLTFSLPPGFQGTLIESRPFQSRPNPVALVRAALAEPLDAPPLAGLWAKSRAKQVCIAFTDTSRACPDHLLVSEILYQLETAGVSPEAITLLAAVGLHRPMTETEMERKLGQPISDRYRVVNHNARDRAELCNQGRTVYGTPLVTNRQAVEADLLIATGVVEPHNFAGYSGGAKTVVIGCGGEETIASTHSPAMIDRPGVRLGQINSNPFQQTMRAAGRAIGLDFALNVVLDGHGQIVAAAAGKPDSVHDRLVDFARKIYEVQISQQFDVAIAGVGTPKDTNIYQATRAATYLCFGPTPVVRPGGIIIVPARCPEGAGTGPGEQRFRQALSQAEDMPSLVTHFRQNGYAPGAQRAYMVARAMAEVEFVVVGSGQSEAVRDCKMTPIETIEAALAYARQKLGPSLKVAVVPHALQTLPILKQ